MIFKVEAFAGINNVDDSLRATRITQSADGDLLLSGDLHSCLNFKLMKDGTAVTRNGRTTKYSAVTASLWTNKARNLCLFVEGSSLKMLNADFTVTTLSSSLTPKRRMTFIEHNNQVFMGNTEQMLKYVNGVLSTWGDTSQSEIDVPQKVYRTPPLGNILLSYYARTYVAEGRFVFYSDSMLPERFKRSWFLTAPEDVTALSADANCMYIHTLNTTTPLIGRDPDDFQQMEAVPIGAVKHGAIRPVDAVIMLGRQGWGIANGGQVAKLDSDNFRLDLADTAEAYLGYDDINNEVIASIWL